MARNACKVCKVCEVCKVYKTCAVLVLCLLHVVAPLNVPTGASGVQGGAVCWQRHVRGGVHAAVVIDEIIKEVQWHVR